MDAKQAIAEGRTALGIELGSTRIKAVLIDESHSPIAAGSSEWENRLENGVWTYGLGDVWAGLRGCFRELAEDARNRHGEELSSVGAIGVSAMMHGYLAFDAGGNQLAPFRTWRNTSTGRAAAELTELFRFNVPQRWSIAHLYQAILDGEPHVGDVAFLTSLAGYVHWKLTGRKALGLCDASGVFPVDGAARGYSGRMLRQFGELVGPWGLGWKIEGILPEVLGAGEMAGALTEEGAGLLDESGRLKPGIPFCAPEGDAGTGMAATGSVAARTGSVSAGTSIFAMVALEKELSRVYPEIDVVATPAGGPVAMVHCNNCATDLDAWVGLFGEFAEAAGGGLGRPELYEMLYSKALEGDADCGGLLSYNYHSGEHITGLGRGRPLFVRLPDGNFTLANFMRSLLFSAMGTLRLGMDVLAGGEGVRLDGLVGQGGLFKTKGVAQRLLAAAMGAPVSVMDCAGEGGAWGAALLAAFALRRRGGESLEKYLAERVFAGKPGSRVEPDPKDAEGFNRFMGRYAAGLAIERAAVRHMPGND